MADPSDIQWDPVAATSATEGIEWDDPRPGRGRLRRFAGAIVPGLFALKKGTPENVAEKAAVARLGDPSLPLAQKAGLLDQTPIGGLLFAPMGGAAGAAAMAPLAQRLDQTAIEQGRKALSGIGTPLAARRQVPEAAVREALDSGAIVPFGTVTGTAKRLETRADALGTEYGRILSELEARGVHGPVAAELAQELSTRAAAASANSLNSPRPGMLQATAEELATKPLPIGPGSGRLGLMQAENMKRGLQAEARREYDKIARQYTTSGETKKEIAALVRQGIEDAVQQQSRLAPAEAAAFQPVKERLANTLGALQVAEEGAARAARRKPISLTSTIVGSAAGSATGNPAAGLAAALAHGVMDSRLASTLAAAANSGSKLASRTWGSGPLNASYAMSPDLAALLRAMGHPALAGAAADDEGIPR